MAPYQGPRGQNTQGLLHKRVGIAAWPLALMEYKRRDDQERRRAADELTGLGQELGEPQYDG